jgi:hypothetical protein
LAPLEGRSRKGFGERYNIEQLHFGGYLGHITKQLASLGMFSPVRTIQ